MPNSRAEKGHLLTIRQDSSVSHICQDLVSGCWWSWPQLLESLGFSLKNTESCDAASTEGDLCWLETRFYFRVPNKCFSNLFRWIIKVKTDSATPAICQSERREINKCSIIIYSTWNQSGQNHHFYPVCSVPRKQKFVDRERQMEAIMLTGLLQQVVLIKTVEKMKAACKIYSKYKINNKMSTG